MATSVRDILATLESTIRVAHRGDKPTVDDALRALTVINEVLRDIEGRYALTRAPFDPGDERHRTTLLEQLRRQTTQFRAPRPTPDTNAGQLTTLLEVARDILSIQEADRPSIHALAEDRWRTAAAISVIAGPLATLALTRRQEPQRAAALRAIIGLTGAITAVAAQDPVLRQPPRPTLDRTIPMAQMPQGLPGSKVADEALTIVVHHIDGSIRGTQPRITLADGLAAIRLGAAASTYCQAISAPATTAPRHAQDSAEAWRHAGILLSRYTDGYIPAAGEPSPVQRFALLGLDGLRAQLGPAANLTPAAVANLPHQVLEDLQRIANQLPQLADALSVESYRWGETHTLITRARDTQLREDRVEAHLADRAVLADRGDLGPVIDTLAVARARNTALAVDLAQSAASPTQPDFTASYNESHNQDRWVLSASLPKHTVHLPDPDLRPGESEHPRQPFHAYQAGSSSEMRSRDFAPTNTRRLRQLLRNVEETRQSSSAASPAHLSQRQPGGGPAR